MEPKSINKRKNKIRITLFGFLVGVSLSFVVGFIGANYIRLPLAIGNMNENKMQEIYRIIKEKWFDINDIGINTNAMASGMVNALGDPYTTYYTSEELNDFKNSVDQNKVGIGIGFNVLSNHVVVSKVFVDSGASKAGIEVGDILLEIDGVSLLDKNKDEVVELIQGKDGSTSHIIIQRDDKTLEMDVTRGNFDTSMLYKIDTSNNKPYGLITLSGFGKTTVSSVENALKDMKNNNIDTIVFDLRNNPGGYVQSAKDILNLMIEKGQTMFYTEYKNGKQKEYISTNSSPYQFVSGYVLINENTASSAEILAGCLQQLLDYQVVGNKSFGKGIIQEQIVLDDLSALKITTSKWFLPDKTCINGKGIEPNIYEDNDKQFDILDFTIDTPLSFDCVDPKVEQLQLMLQELGYGVDRTDGYFSMATQDALESFEKDNQLEVNGIFEEKDKEILVLKCLQYRYKNIHDKQMEKVQSLIQ